MSWKMHSPILLYLFIYSSINSSDDNLPALISSHHHPSTFNHHSAIVSSSDITTASPSSHHHITSSSHHHHHISPSYHHIVITSPPPACTDVPPTQCMMPSEHYTHLLSTQCDQDPVMGWDVCVPMVKCPVYDETNKCGEMCKEEGDDTEKVCVQDIYVNTCSISLLDWLGVWVGNGSRMLLT